MKEKSNIQKQHSNKSLVRDSQLKALLTQQLGRYAVQTMNQN